MALTTGVLGNVYASAITQGDNTQAHFDHGVAIGDDSKSTAARGTAIGYGAEASNQDVTAVGAGAKASGQYALALGNKANASNTDAVAVGASAAATDTFTLAIGNSSVASGGSAVAVGSGAASTNYASTALGNDSKATGGKSVAVGKFANAAGNQGVAVGFSAVASKESAVAIGNSAGTNEAHASGDTVLIGTNAGNGSGNMAVHHTADGKDLLANGGEVGNHAQIAIGIDSGKSVNGADNIALGRQAGQNTTGNTNVAISTNAGQNVDGHDNFAALLSAGKEITGSSNIAIGKDAGRGKSGNKLSINRTVALSENAMATKDDAVAIGSDSKSEGASAVALGKDSHAVNENDVALGTGSETAVAVGTTSASINGETKNFAGTAPASTVSVGKSGTERTITNVAAGRVSATSTDAINGSQLFGVVEEVNKGVVYAGDVKSSAVSANAFMQRLGAQTNIVGGVTAESDLTDNNIGVVSNGTDTLTVKLKKNIDLGDNGSVKMGDTIVNNGGMTITGGPSVTKTGGINANNTVITNVASGGDTGTNGANISDVINKVNAASWTIQQNGTAVNNVRNGSKINFVNGTGTKVTVTKKAECVTDVSYGLDDDTKIKVDNALQSIVTTADGTDAQTVTKTSNKANFKSGSNIQLTAGTDGITVATKDDVTFTTVKAGDTTINNAGMTITGGPSVTKTGIDGGSKKITNVANGTDPNDAVNMSQLTNAINGTAKATTVKAKDSNVTVTEGTNGAGGKEYTVGLGNVVNVGTTHPVTVNGDTGTVGGLTNKTWNVKTSTPVDGQAATENQLKSVSDAVNGNTTNITKNAGDISTINTTIGKGLNFKGDDATVINKKLGEQLDIKGGADSTKLSDNNIGVVSDNGALNVKLSKELTGLTSVKAGDTTINSDGMTITGGPSITKTGIDAGNKQITNVASGGNVDTNGANIGDITRIVNANKTILKDGKNTTVEGDGSAANPYKVNVNDNINLGKAGADGKDGSIGLKGKDGSSVTLNGKDGISVKGKDGKDGVTIKGMDGQGGTDGHIGLNGKDGASADIHVKDGDPGVNGAPGTNMTRIVYEDKNGESHQVATLDDGMKYGGDTGSVIKKKLNEQVNVIGGITDEAKLTTEDNLGVVSDGSNNLKVRLAKALKGLESVTTGDTVMNNKGITINNGTAGNTVSLTKDGLNNGGNKITNVAAGDVSANSTDAVNGGQLHEVKTLAGQHTTVKAKDSNVTVTEGTNTTGGKEYTVGLGDKVTLGSDPSKQVSIDGTTGIIKAGDKVTIDGTKGNIDAGKVKIDGENGKIGGLENKTWNPNNFTSGQAATEDQLKVVDDKITNTSMELINKGINFAGNEGEFHRNLGEKATIKGEGTKAASEYSGENIKTFADANGNITVKMDKNLKTETIVATGKDGKDGKIGINGKDGVTTNISVTRDGKPGVDGTSGTNMTRIVYEKPDGAKEEVATLNDGMKYGGDTGTIIKKKLNEQVNVIGGITDEAKLTTEDNLGVVSDGNNNLKVKLAKELKGLDSVTASTVNATTIKAGDTVTINNQGADMGGTKVTNLKDGDISENSKDAVNGSQLYATNQQVAANTQNINNLGGAINNLDKRVNRVGAGAAALAALHPLDFDPDDKWDVAAGYGNYKNADAVAIGAFYRPNEDTMFSVGGSFGGGENMVNAGVSVKLGQGRNVSRGRVAVAKDVAELNVKVAKLEEQNKQLMDTIQKLAGLSGKNLDVNFPDLPKDHWAYTYVKTLADKGYLVGYPDGEFKGDRSMTRYEYAAIVYRALQNGAPVDADMGKSLGEFGPEIEKVAEADRFRVDRISGKDNDRNKVERVRVNSDDNKDKKDYRDVFGSHIQKQ